MRRLSLSRILQTSYQWQSTIGESSECSTETFLSTSSPRSTALFFFLNAPAPPDIPPFPPHAPLPIPTRRTTLYRAPDGPPAGAITSETPLRVLSRSGEWARVQFEGWVKTSDLQTNTPGVLVGVSAAELRTDPARFQGQVLKWRLVVIAAGGAARSRPRVPPAPPPPLARAARPAARAASRLV